MHQRKSMQRKLNQVTALAAFMMVCSAVWAAPPISTVDNLWELAFAEEFDGSLLDPNIWEIEDDACYSSTGVCQRADNVFLSGGQLHIMTSTADPNDPNGVTYNTGRVDLSYALEAGYIEVAARLTADSGIGNSVWMLDTAPNVLLGYHPDPNTLPFDWNLANTVGGFGYTDEYILGASDPFPGATDLSADFNVYSVLRTESGSVLWEVNDSETSRTQIPVGLVQAPSSGIAIASSIRPDYYGFTSNPIGTSFDLDYLRIWQKRDICLGGDSFNYPAGSLDGRYGGQAWDSPWSVTSGTVEVEGLGDNLATSFVTLPTASGDRVVAAAGDVAIRELSTPIELFTSNTYWISMLVKKDDAGDFRVQFRRTDGIVRMQFGADASEGVFTGVVGATTTPNAMPIDETVLILVQIACGSPDTARIAVYKAGDVLPATESQIVWVAEDANNSSVANQFLDIDIFAGNVEVDELKIGLSLEDVLAPEGAPFASESFDYADATLDLKNGGAGWADPWITTQTGMLSNDDVSLDYPDSPSTKPISGSGDTLVLTDGTAERTIIDDFGLFNSDTFFMSFLANKSASGELLVEGLDSNDNNRWRVGLRGNNQVIGGVASTLSSADQGTISDPNSLTYPASVSLSTNGSRIAHEGFGEARLSLSSVASAAGGEKWVSFLARKDATGVFNVNFERASDGLQRWNIAVSKNGMVAGQIFGDGDGLDETDPNTFPNDEAVLVISQFVGDPSADIVRVAIIDQNETLPANAASIVWDTEASTSTSVAMNTLVIKTIAGLVEIDEIRYGDTYESVTSTDSSLNDADSIDYLGGSIDGQGGWSGDLNVAGEINNSLEYPALTPAIALGTAGGRIAGGIGSATLDDVRPNIFTHDDPPITRWISFLAQKDATGAFTIKATRETDGLTRWYFDVNADGSLSAKVWGIVQHSDPGAFPNNETVMVFARYTGDTRSLDPNYSDRVDVLVLQSGENLPADEADIDTNNLWDVTQMGHTTVNMQELAIDVTAGNVQIDELRFGDTYESVIGADPNNLYISDDFNYASGPIGGNTNAGNVWEGSLNVVGSTESFADQTVFVLSMFQAVSDLDLDTVYVKTFRSASELPATLSEISAWDLIVEGQSNVRVSKLRMSSTGGAPVKLDELKVGTTYASVTAFDLVGDCNNDDVLDANDFLCIEPCVDGPDNGLAEGCEAADIDGDGDADVRDIALLAQSL